MSDLRLDAEVIDRVKKESVPKLRDIVGNNLRQVILYGSCARGDYNQDSDIDIAVLTECDRMEAKKYDDKLDEVATEFAMKYFAIVNFVCLPQKEFEEKKKWYLYFKNIDKEGEILYG